MMAELPRITYSLSASASYGWITTEKWIDYFDIESTFTSCANAHTKHQFKEDATTSTWKPIAARGQHFIDEISDSNKEEKEKKMVDRNNTVLVNW